MVDTPEQRGDDAYDEEQYEEQLQQAMWDGDELNELLRDESTVAAMTDMVLEKAMARMQEDALVEVLHDEEASAKVLAEVLVPVVSEDTCDARGWPVEAFRACAAGGCARKCMLQLVRDQPELLDSRSSELKAIRDRDMAAATSGPPGAAAARSIWCADCGTAGSASNVLLDAVVSEDQARAAASPVAESETAAVLRVFHELTGRGICTKGAIAFCGRSNKWLRRTRTRGEGGGGARLDTQAAELPTVEDALSWTCSCTGACGSRVPRDAICLLRAAPTKLAVKTFMWSMPGICNGRMKRFVKIGNSTLSGYRRELKEDGMPLPRDVPHGLVLYRASNAPKNKTSDATVLISPPHTCISPLPSPPISRTYFSSPSTRTSTHPFISAPSPGGRADRAAREGNHQYP